MPSTNVKTRWNGGDLEFLDKSGNVIATFDGTNRKITVPSGSQLDVDASALSIAIKVDGSSIENDATNGLQVKALGVVDAMVSTTAAIARTKLATEALLVDLEDKFMSDTGQPLAASEAAGSFYRALGTNQWLITGEAAVNETEASVGLFSFQLPENYVAGGTITLRASAFVTVAGDAVLNASSTIDMEARKVTKTTGAVGSDLVTTAATAIVAAGANYDFTVTPTGLVAGDKLVCKLTTSIIEDAGGTGAATAVITALGAVLQVKG